jgi:CheY-like chemotaxis protein
MKCCYAQIDIPANVDLWQVQKTIMNMLSASLLQLKGKAMPHAIIVDDNALNVQIFSQALESFGWSVSTFTSGQQTIEACQTKRADLVLLDYHMPGMNGVDVMYKLRENPNLRDVGIYLYTAAKPELVVDHVKPGGLTGVIRKPMDLLMLKSLIDKHQP